MDAINDSGIDDTRRGMNERVEALRESEPNFARFMQATVSATDPDDLSLYSPPVLEAMLRKTYTRLGKREGRSHVIFDFAPEKPGQSEILGIFSADLPFIVHSAP